jgi:hypothetical protein
MMGPLFAISLHTTPLTALTKTPRALPCWKPHHPMDGVDPSDFFSPTIKVTQDSQRALGGINAVDKLGHLKIIPRIWQSSFSSSACNSALLRLLRNLLIYCGKITPNHPFISSRISILVSAAVHLRLPMLGAGATTVNIPQEASV